MSCFCCGSTCVDVTVIEVAPTILETEDDEARSIIREKMEKFELPFWKELA